MVVFWKKKYYCILKILQISQFFTQNPEGIDERLSDYKYYVYYYSQKPLDPRLPKPLLHWDKNMTEGYYKAYVNALLEKQKQSQKPKIHDLAVEFEQKAKINEANNENSSEDNNCGNLLDDVINDIDTSTGNQTQTTPKMQQIMDPFASIVKPQPQVPNYNPNNKPVNAYQHFGYSAPPNQLFGQK